MGPLVLVDEGLTRESEGGSGMAESQHWVDPGSNYPCAALRNPSLGIWCGYVGVPQEHPWFGLPYNARVKLPKEWLERPRSLQGVSIIDLFLAAVRGDDPAEGVEIALALEVHGGITFAGDELPRGKSPEGFYWFGFDCGHAGDMLPCMGAIIPGGQFRRVDYVVAECSSLAQQLHDVALKCEKTPPTL
jgi:hypothetical protein